MSGDLRAKKNTKTLKTGGNKREKDNRASPFQQFDTQEEYEREHGMVDCNKKGEFIINNDKEEDDDDRIITTKVIYI